MANWLEPQAVAVSPYGWLMTHYGWLAGLSRLAHIRRWRKLWRLTAAWRIIYSVSQKITTPPDFFLRFFSNGSEFLVQIKFYLPIIRSYLPWTTNFYSIICNLDEVNAILSTTTIICSKRPPSVESHVRWSNLILSNFVTVGDNWIKICSLA